MPADPRFLTSQQAAFALGITRASLYAYTSRGQLQSEAVPGRPRERCYLREDVERLRERKETRRDPARAASRGLHWGSPVLESGITLIHDGKLYYRGRDVLEMAKSATLEETAELLWGGPLGESECPLTSQQLKGLRACSRDPMTLLQMSLPIAGAHDIGAFDLRPAAVRQAGARILRLLGTVIAGRESRQPVHRMLSDAWKSANENVIRAALVLCADHELNVSAFTARCAASAGATSYDVVSAALATLKGNRHGGSTERVDRLFAEIAEPNDARKVLAERLRRGELIPGFGHPLYPAGDPRAMSMLKMIEASANHPESKRIRALRKAGWDLLQDHPNLDFALAALSRAYGLPERAPLLLFALGRTVGWIAHAMEQYAIGELIRPRARYTGIAPETRV